MTTHEAIATLIEDAIEIGMHPAGHTLTLRIAALRALQAGRMADALERIASCAREDATGQAVLQARGDP